MLGWGSATDAGVPAATARAAATGWTTRSTRGGRPASMSPFNAWVTTRGVRTLPRLPKTEAEPVVHAPDTAFPWDGTDQKNVFLAGHRLGPRGEDGRLIFYDLDSLEATRSAHYLQRLAQPDLRRHRGRRPPRSAPRRRRPERPGRRCRRAPAPSAPGPAQGGVLLGLRTADRLGGPRTRDRRVPVPRADGRGPCGAVAAARGRSGTALHGLVRARRRAAHRRARSAQACPR